MTATVDARWAEDGSLQMSAPTGTRNAIENMVRDAMAIEAMIVDAESFRAAIKRVEHAASRDPEGSPILCTLHVTHGRVETADNYRVSRSSFGCEPCEGDFLVHINDAPVLLAWLATMEGPVEVAITADDLTFHSGAASLTLPRFVGKYPRVEAIVPDEPAPVEIALSASFLGDLKKLGKGVLRLSLWGNERVVLFTRIADGDVSELLMPARVPGITGWGKPADKAVDPDTGELRD